MAGLTTTHDPAALSFLFTEALYAPAEANPMPGANVTVSTETQAHTKAKTVRPATAKAPESSAAENSAEVVREPQEEVFHYLGENRRFVLVLVNYPGEDFLPSEEKEYLEKILSAVKLEPDDVALLNYARYAGKSYAELKDFFAFGNLLLFGVTPHQLQIPGPVLPYHLGLVEEIKILAADSTEVFRPDNQKKKQLWGELQRMFS